MHKKPEPQSALSFGYSNMLLKSGEVTLAWASAMPSCSTEKSLIKNYAPRSYPHSPEQIAEEIRVDGEGRLWWKKQIDGKGPQRKLNKPVGRLSVRGYIQVWFKGHHYTGHSIAFCLYYGRWPVANLEAIQGYAGGGCEFRESK